MSDFFCGIGARVIAYRISVEFVRPVTHWYLCYCGIVHLLIKLKIFFYAAKHSLKDPGSFYYVDNEGWFIEVVFVSNLLDYSFDD